jgi:hypothetical protein
MSCQSLVQQACQHALRSRLRLPVTAPKRADLAHRGEFSRFHTRDAPPPFSHSQRRATDARPPVRRFRFIHARTTCASLFARDAHSDPRERISRSRSSRSEPRARPALALTLKHLPTFRPEMTRERSHRRVIRSRELIEENSYQSIELRSYRSRAISSGCRNGKRWPSHLRRTWRTRRYTCSTGRSGRCSCRTSGS